MQSSLGLKRAGRISQPWQVMAYTAGWERKNRKVTKPQRSLRHVVHRPNRKCLWQVVIRRKYVGSYQTQSLAAAASAKHNGETPNSLLQEGRLRSLELSRRCFVEFWKACKTKGSCTHCLPEDLKHLFMCKNGNDPWMVAYVILAKYGPHRDALCKAYAELFDPNDMAKWHRGPGKRCLLQWLARIPKGVWLL